MGLKTRRIGIISGLLVLMLFFVASASAQPPLPAEFVVSGLSITPEEAESGEEVEISFTVTNVGEEPGNYTFRLYIDHHYILGTAYILHEEEVTLEGGESETVLYTLVPERGGSYNVDVDGLRSSFMVKLLPAEFVVSYLSASPDEVKEGEVVTFSVMVRNIGESEGSYIVEFKVDGETVDTESVTLAGWETVTVSFEETWSAGVYQVEVEDLMDKFIVAEISITPFWMRRGTIAGIIIIIAAATILYAYWKGILSINLPRSRARSTR